MLPPASIDTRLNAYYLLYNGYAIPCSPAGGPVKLTTEAGPDEAGKGQFFDRLKLTPDLTFQGEDFKLLYGIETSNARCQQLGLLLRTRPYLGAPWRNEWQGAFTCNTCKFDPVNCRVTVTVATDDAYAELLSAYEQEYNLLPSDAAVARQTITARLREFLNGSEIEFLHAGLDVLADYEGVDGWTRFLTFDYFVDGLSGREDSVILFRYSRRNVSQVLIGGQYFWPDFSKSGYERIEASSTENDTPQPPQPWAADYAKTPDIAGFSAPLIHSVIAGNNYTPFLTPGQYVYDSRGRGGKVGFVPPVVIENLGDPVNGLTFLACELSQSPASFGLDPLDWLEITGPSRPPRDLSPAGANSAPDCSASLNIRPEVDDNNCRRVYWKFGTFTFDRCIPLLDAIYWLLYQTGAPEPDIANPGYVPPVRPAVLALLPASSLQLSSFYADTINQATGEGLGVNELPGLVLSAGSDVKRFNASEPATRLPVSLKTVLDDLSALYDVGWFIDPGTGKLRIEHRAFRENQLGSGLTYDLTTAPNPILPSTYTYRSAQLPRYEELVISNALTENIAAGIYYAKAALDYGVSGCSNEQQGQNRLVRTSSRLTGDIPALVLSGASMADDCIAILAPDPDGRLPDANARVSASLLLARYHRFGMVSPQAVVSPGNLVVNAQSLRPQRVVENQSVSACSLAMLEGVTQYVTALGPDGVLNKSELDLSERTLTVTLWLPTPTYAGDPPVVTGHQFDRSFSDSFL